MMADALAVKACILTISERVTPGGVQKTIVSRACIISQTFLTRVVPFEDTVRGDAAVQDSRHRSHVEILISGDEATAVAIASRTRRERDHIATTELEGTNLIVQLGIREGVHKATIVLKAEVADGRAAIVLLTIDRQWRIFLGVGIDDGTLCMDTDVTVGSSHSFLTIDLKI